MLCSKCNTAMSETDAVCGYCGAKPGGKKTGMFAAAAFFMTLCVITGLYFYLAQIRTDMPEHIADETETPLVATGTPAPTRPPASSGEAVPSYTPDYNKTMDEIRLLVDSVAKAAQDFYAEFSAFSVYVTKNGYFFEYSSSQYIKTEDLTDPDPEFALTDLDPEYADESVLILYLKPSDLAAYSQLDVSRSDTLELFAAYETKDGFVIASVKNPGGVLPREELFRVLEKYDYYHGEPRTVPYGGEDFNRIIAALVRDARVAPDSDIRYLKQDDKYAVAILSPRDDPTDVNQFILKKENGGWSVVIFNYEMYDKHKAVINAELVDLNLEMVPRDDLTVLKKYFRRSYTDVIGTMVMNSFVMDEDGAAVYQAGTNNFCYIIFESGRRFLGFLDNDTWTMHEVRTYEEAVEKMEALQKWPPIVILRQY